MNEFQNGYLEKKSIWKNIQKRPNELIVYTLRRGELLG